MHSLGKMARKRWPILVLALALLAPGACTPDKKAQEELHQEIKGLKAEIKDLQEKLDKLERGQQDILQLLRKPAPTPPPVATAPPPPPEPLTVSQLLKDKERLQGTRVTVKGMPGTVLVHRQMMLMRVPEGTLEVFFGDIPDTLTIHRLTSTTLNHPLSVTGILYLSPKGVGNPRINAEAIEF